VLGCQPRHLQTAAASPTGPAAAAAAAAALCVQVLSWIDVCAGLSAKTLARGPCVTISVDAVHFFRCGKPACGGISRMELHRM
jgi:hypothetical protein